MSHPFADMLREVVAGTRVDSGMSKAKPAPAPVAEAPKAKAKKATGSTANEEAPSANRN